MGQVYNALRITFFTLFGLALLWVAGMNLLHHIANPPSLQGVGIACGIGLLMGLWYWHSAKTQPYVRWGHQGTRVTEWPHGLVMCEYPDGTTLHLLHHRLQRWDCPSS